MNLNSFNKIILATLLASQTFLEAAQISSVPAPTNYPAFSKFIADRNIFDPNRRPNVVFTTYTPRTNPPPVRRNSFSLVGTMNYGEGESSGTYAFFDGTSSQYSKAVVVNDTIAIFKVEAITTDSVTLVSETNKTVMKLGDQMRDDTEGKWHHQVQTSFTSSTYPTRTSRTTSTFGSGNGNQSGGRRRGTNGSNDTAPGFGNPNGNRNQNNLNNQPIRTPRGGTDNLQNTQGNQGDNANVVTPEDFAPIIEALRQQLAPDSGAAPETPAEPAPETPATNNDNSPAP